MGSDTLDEYLQGKKLYGDDFSPDEIEQWFKDEEEAYADLGAKDRPKNYYGAHALNHYGLKQKRILTAVPPIDIGQLAVKQVQGGGGS